MSSGRLFLDRVGRHQSPSPLHRRDQNKSIARSEETIYHRAVSSVLTGCLTFRDKRNLSSLFANRGLTASADTLYGIYFPSGMKIVLSDGTSCSSFCGYHSHYAYNGI